MKKYSGQAFISLCFERRDVLKIKVFALRKWRKRLKILLVYDLSVILVDILGFETIFPKMFRYKSSFCLKLLINQLFEDTSEIFFAPRDCFEGNSSSRFCEIYISKATSHPQCLQSITCLFFRKQTLLFFLLLL